MLTDASCRKMIQCDHMCFCNSCLGHPDDDMEHDNSDYVDLTVLYVYPDYVHQTLEGEDENMCRLIHKYLVHIKRVPPPFEKTTTREMLIKHIEIMNYTSYITCTGHQTLDDIKKRVESSSCRTKVLFMMFCGHGTSTGVFLASNGEQIDPNKIALWLKGVGFKGTVICVFNCCHAEPPMLEVGWKTLELPFKWIHIYSCGPTEDQVPSHAAHVVRLIRSLVDKNVTYEAFLDHVDNAWVETRDQSQTSSKWRGPTTVSMGSCVYSGTFMKPIE